MAKSILVAVLAVFVATTAHARKPDRTPPPPTSPVLVDSAGAMVGPVIGFVGDSTVETLVTSPTGEPVRISRQSGEWNGNSNDGRVFYEDSNCNSDPHIGTSETSLVGVSAAGRTGMLYIVPSTPIVRVFRRSQYEFGRCYGPLGGTYIDAGRAEPLPLPFTAPFHVEVR